MKESWVYSFVELGGESSLFFQPNLCQFITLVYVLCQEVTSLLWYRCFYISKHVWLNNKYSGEKVTKNDRLFNLYTII